MTTPMNRETRRLRLVLLTLLLTSFTLIALDYRTGHGSPFSIVRRAGAAVFGPIERAFSSAVHPVLHLHVGSDSGQLTKLRDENAQLQAQLRAANSDQRRIAELNSLLGLSSSGGYVTVPARLVAISGAPGFERTATIDAGPRAG